MTTTPARQPQQEYLSITSEELLIIEHGCIYPYNDACVGNYCKYHDPNPSFRDNIVCLLNEHDVADRVRSRTHTSAQARIGAVVKELERLKQIYERDRNSRESISAQYEVSDSVAFAYERAIALLKNGVGK